MIKRTYIGMVKLKIMLAARIVNRENYPITTYKYHGAMYIFEFIISFFFGKTEIFIFIVFYECDRLKKK